MAWRICFFFFFFFFFLCGEIRKISNVVLKKKHYLEVCFLESSSFTPELSLLIFVLLSFSLSLFS